MIELKQDELLFSFPEVHRKAKLRVDFQRTLRIPDDGSDYPLPPALGRFPLQHVDDHAAEVPPDWLRHGGVMLPMYQSEAMWLQFTSEWIEDRRAAYPFAIKIATGKRCAVSGSEWSPLLHRGPQDYLVAPIQPWLDGFVVEKGYVRQFVAMPLGAGYTAEEQITGTAEHGGLQISVAPMKREVFEKRFPVQEPREYEYQFAVSCLMDCSEGGSMGLAPGGRMRQEVYEDPYELADWSLDASSRCFVHLCNSLVWNSITGDHPPHPTPTAKQYTKAGLPWFDYYDDNANALEASILLSEMKSVSQVSAEKGDVALPENEAVTPDNVIVYRRGLRPGQVREGGSEYRIG